MREINFRGKCVETGEWKYGYYVNTVMPGLYPDVPLEQARVYHLIINDAMMWHVDPSTVGQYTGLKDEKGVEIYEDDIVENIGRWSKMDYSRQIVKHEYASFFPFDESDWGWLASECKKIGDIYENPELLE